MKADPDIVFELNTFAVDGVEYDALVKTVPRSFRMDIWAAPSRRFAPRSAAQTYELIWLDRVPAPESKDTDSINDIVCTAIKQHKHKMFEAKQ